MALNERYSCDLDNPLLETGEGLEKTLEMLSCLGYAPKDFGRTNIGSNYRTENKEYRDLAFMLLGKKEESIGLVNRTELFPDRKEGYIAYHLRY